MIFADFSVNYYQIVQALLYNVVAIILLISNPVCLKGGVISFFSPSSEGSPAQFSLYAHKGGLKPHSFHLYPYDVLLIAWFQ